MKKVLILTDERCGGVSFQNIVSSFYSSLNDLKRLKSLLGGKEPQDPYRLCKFLLRDYNSSNVTIENIDDLKAAYKDFFKKHKK